MTKTYCNLERRGLGEATSDNLIECHYICIKISPAWSQFIPFYFQPVFCLILAQLPKTWLHSLADFPPTGRVSVPHFSNVGYILIEIYSLFHPHISLERRYYSIYIYYIRRLIPPDFFCSQLCGFLSPNLRGAAASPTTHKIW